MASKKKNKTIWVLTSEYNEYDQYGCYFEAAFEEKPTMEDLSSFLGPDMWQDCRFPSEDSFLIHILNGGGRTARNEDMWYNLKEYETL